MSLIFQPLLPGSTKGLANLNDLDPDPQLSIFDTCTYTENKFNNSIASSNLQLFAIKHKPHTFSRVFCRLKAVHLQLETEVHEPRT